jgi:hypothetical protein
MLYDRTAHPFSHDGVLPGKAEERAPRVEAKPAGGLVCTFDATLTGGAAGGLKEP